MLQEALNVPHLIKWRNYTFQIRLRTQYQKAVLERWCKSHAVQQCFALKPTLPPAQFQFLYDSVRQDITGDKYAYGSEGFNVLINTPEGRVAEYRTYLGAEGENLTDDEMRDFVIDKGEELVMYRQEQDKEYIALLKELGWTEKDGKIVPPGDDKDQKKTEAALRAKGYWD